MYIMDGITERITETASANKHWINNAEAKHVWCVSVPNKTIVTRHKGRVLITGNCSPQWCGYYKSCVYVGNSPKKNWF